MIARKNINMERRKLYIPLGINDGGVMNPFHITNLLGGDRAFCKQTPYSDNVLCDVASGYALCLRL